jgi:hypothetical protein
MQIVKSFVHLALLGAVLGLGFGLVTSMWLANIWNDPGEQWLHAMDDVSTQDTAWKGDTASGGVHDSDPLGQAWSYPSISGRFWVAIIWDRSAFHGSRLAAVQGAPRGCSHTVDA